MMLTNTPTTPSNPIHLIESAVGALKLHALHLQHPATVNADQAIAAGQDAMKRLAMIDREALALAEAYALVRKFAPQQMQVSVRPAGGNRIAAVLHSQDKVHHTVVAKSPAGLMELLAVQLQVAQEVAV